MAKDRNENIKYLLEPRAIGIIGASANRWKIGNSVVRNIVTGGYKGKVFPVNPKEREIEGVPVYRSILDVKDDIDAVCITVPAPLVFEAIKQCCERSVKYGLVITSGFSEVGNVKEEREIVDYANSRGMRILGPNIFGIYSSKASLNATFGGGAIARPGNLAIVTQSGALGGAMAAQAGVENIGLSAIVPVGNKSDIDEADLLHYFIDDDHTRALLLYIEGVKDGASLLGALKATAKRKPVIFVKSGRSARGAMAAASHTGSLAGSDEVFEDVIRQCGGLRAENIREAFQWCKFLADNPLPAGDNTVIVTNGGGAGVMATDACEKYDVRLYDDFEVLRAAFSPVIPSFGSTKNPIDLTGQATAEIYTKAFDAAYADENIHSALGIYVESALLNAESLARVVEPNYERFKEAGKPLLFTLIGGAGTASYEDAARKKGFPVTTEVYDSVACLGAVYAYKRFKDSGPEDSIDADIDAQAIENIVAAAKQDRRTSLLSSEAQNIMKIAGVGIPKSLIAMTMEGAVKSAAAIGYPVVMKVVSRDILHKSDAGGIAIDLENREEVIDAYGAILRNCRAHVPNALIEGVEISEMVQPGTEMIVGARIDKTFGPIVMVGHGGIYVEVMKDVSFRALPLTRSDILSMIKQIRSYPLLLGVRGEKMKDIETLVDTILKLGAIVDKCEGISDIEINPLVIYEQGQGARAVDVRIILSRD
ncbi:MAG: acetate--CoA ligase family protein [Deltaproteobacteria bacterium]|nr:acetate--CoA ligase family protein [Deltaproteobacteria bacterium]